ncbi:MAG TPA: cytochrome b N-terminal domain-containing protein [Pyrinomonadaceae bacterium]|jgi:ubiquinol-cytochrome c reductase cytochrome b subunit
MKSTRDQSRTLESPKLPAREAGWLSRWTKLAETSGALFDVPPGGSLEAWARTTVAAVALLLLLQLTTGLLLAFYYVPSTESAHTTVAFIEKVVPAGSWIRALHSHGSGWLVVALVLHLAQRLFVREGWRRRPVGWVASIALLALALAGGASGYSLPWDARAFYSTRVAASITSHLPLIGEHAHAWLVGGAELSTLTLSRFYALHAFVIPLLILALGVVRLFIFREPAAPIETNADASRPAWMRAQLARQMLVAGLVFLALALYAWIVPAPLSPTPEEAAPGYLPRPGAQFLWLFQLLKYLPAPLASLLASLLPLVLLGGLALLPLLDRSRLSRFTAQTLPRAGVVLFTFGLALVAAMTALALVEDARDARISEQLSRQRQQEATFRVAPFEPRRTDTSRTDARSFAASGHERVAPDERADASGLSSTNAANSVLPPPEAYTKHCARCHGANGEGRFANPKLVGVSAQPRRTLEDIVNILDDPASYGLERRMPSFARKLTEEEKRAVAEWVVSLKP